MDGDGLSANEIVRRWQVSRGAVRYWILRLALRPIRTVGRIHLYSMADARRVLKSIRATNRKAVSA